MKLLSNRQFCLETREREPKEEEIHSKEGLKARQKKKHGPKEAEKNHFSDSLCVFKVPDSMKKIRRG